MFWQNFHKISLSILVIFIGLSFLIWPDKWKGLLNSGSSEEIQRLQDQNKDILLENKLIKKDREILWQRVYQDSLKLDSLKDGVIIIDSEISKVDNSIIVTKKQLERIKKEQEELKKTIDKIKSSPNENKRGDELIFSIKTRLK